MNECFFLTRKQPIKLKTLLVHIFLIYMSKYINYHKKTASTFVNESNSFFEDI